MSTQTEIVIRGAREHNLRDVSLTIPKNQLVVMTGVSGSGKSSLAFDTLYAEGQRRYVESLSTYARQFLGQLPKPDCDSITGLAPCISIEQKTAGRNPRSTVGTMTEIYDFLRVLFARVGQGYCYVSGKPIQAQSTDQIVQAIARLPEQTPVMLLAPLAQQQKGEFRDLFEDLQKKGYLRVRVDGEFHHLSQTPTLKKHYKHDIEVVVDRLKIGQAKRSRLGEAVEQALRLGNGLLICYQGKEVPDDPNMKPAEKLYSANYSCPESGMSYEAPTPQLFSFNSPQGMCHECNGLGVRQEFLLDRLITKTNLSISKGAIELMGSFGKVGKWRKHIYKGGAAVIEKECGLAKDSLLKTAWEKLPEQAQQQFLHGLGDRNVTYTWRSGGRTYKHGGTFDGYLAELQENYRTAKNPMRRKQLEKYMEVVTCTSCNGSRLNKQARHVLITTESEEFEKEYGKASLNLPEVCSLPVGQAVQFFSQLQLDETGHLIASEVLKEIRGRLGFLSQCGLDYLALDRTAPTLSGGESQRIRLAGQIGCGLVGVVYIMDEPSIGLHPRDNDMLLGSLLGLRDQGNTVIVVEHDEETMRAADYVVDFGPGPGVLGGELVVEGRVDDIKQCERSVTGAYLSGRKEIPIPEQRREKSESLLTIKGASHNNLKSVDVELPLGRFVCVTGVSGSGKSSLVNDILWQVLNREINKGNGEPGDHESIQGLEAIDKAIDIDQSPIGRTPRSNPATYVKVFDLIRDLYTKLPESRLRGYKPGRFSFNVSGGRCEACEGYGATKLEMDFLADLWVTCPVCEGKRFNQETRQVKYKDYSISDVLDLDIQQAIEVFENHPKILRLLTALNDVGLGYLKLGQPSPTLSGGEAQRVKLARELGKRSTGKTFYLLDEPTTGLHFADVHQLIKVLQNLVEAGNTVLVVEHHLDVIKSADWVIDLGPEGGAGGGEILVCGTPEDVAAHPQSYTGKALRSVLPDVVVRPPKSRKKKSTAKQSAPVLEAVARVTSPPTAQKQTIHIEGAAQHNLQHVDLEIPRYEMSLFCGPSGSGKTSLAMDTLYAEGQRRYVESLSSYARQFIGQMPKPVVERIEGLSPAIAIEQKTVGSTPRSTVGTVTEIYDYLRVLYARLGQQYCPECEIPVSHYTVDGIVDRILQYPEQTRLLLLSRIALKKGQKYAELWEQLQSQGFRRIRVNGEVYEIEEAPKLRKSASHVIEIVIDRLSVAVKSRSRINDSVESALEWGKGVLYIAEVDPEHEETDWTVHRFSLLRTCLGCDQSFEPLTPQGFSFNSPLGWCDACEGIGTEQGMDFSAVVSDPFRSIDQGAITAWPNAGEAEVFDHAMNAVAQTAEIATDVPYQRLAPKSQRALLQGREGWVPVPEIKGLSVEYKGIYPAIDEAVKASYAYRQSFYRLVGEQPCSSCQGARIKVDSAAVRFRNLTLAQFTQLPLGQALDFLLTLELTDQEQHIAGDVVEEVRSRLAFLVDVGLDYLSLDRGMPTLSGGESQRIRLAGQIGRALTGVLYVLDEPTIGLHPRDNSRLIRALHAIRDLGNTVVLVEHDQEVIEASDAIYDFGPGSGRHGGSITGQGSLKQLTQLKDSLTGQYLSGKQAITIPNSRRMDARQTALPKDEVIEMPTPANGWLQLTGARLHNLRNVDLRIPLGTLTCLTGVSGAGKSSLIEGTLAPLIKRELSQSSTTPGPHDQLLGLDQLKKMIVVDQQPLGVTPASNPATYTGVFDEIRQLFTQLPEAKIRGYQPARFSFNRPGGRCDDCEGMGQKKIEMHFLPDIWVECPTCKGKRYNAETLEVRFRDRTIADVLNLPVGEALELFENIPKIRRVLAVLSAIGLDYLTLGQSATTLSGGEAQRVKLAAELARPNSGQTLYLLDEPTTGLHFDDIKKLLTVLNSLVDAGNSVVVIEHNLDVIKSADWLIDVGPEAGVGGGWIVAEGTPEDVVSHAMLERQQASKQKSKRKTAEPERMRSHTGEMLAPVLEQGTTAERDSFDVAAVAKKREGDLSISEIGKGEAAPWEQDGRKWHTGPHLSHNGKQTQWEGDALTMIIDRLAEFEKFKEPNWKHRSIVELRSDDVEDAKTWFLHALTGDQWLMTLKFRVPKGTFTDKELRRKIRLTDVDDLDDLPVYNRAKRITVKNTKGPDQEVAITVHKLEEINTPAFTKFLDQAATAYLQTEETPKLDATELLPWKALGKAWHLKDRGFAEPAHWDLKALPKLLQWLEESETPLSFQYEQRDRIEILHGEDEERIPLGMIMTKEPDTLTFCLPADPDEQPPADWLDEVGVFMIDHPIGAMMMICFTKPEQIEHEVVDYWMKALLAEALQMTREHHTGE